jgi:hypothetical protein
MMRFVSFVAAGLIGLVLFGCVVFVLGSMVDGYGDYQDQHERCLKQATNGYDIQRCR